MDSYVIVEFGPASQGRDAVQVYGPFDGEPPEPEELSRRWQWSRWTTGVVARKLQDGSGRLSE